MRAVRGVLALAVLMMAGCTADDPAPTDRPVASPPASPAGGAAECPPEVRTGPLPEWARAGFSGDAAVPHVLGDRGDIVAVLFGHPLHQPPLAGRNNKILWVSRAPVTSGEDLLIEARSGEPGDPESTVSREVAGGPGPSIIDLPKAGCWSLTLKWSGHTDTMLLEYLPPPVQPS